MPPTWLLVLLAIVLVVLVAVVRDFETEREERDGPAARVMGLDSEGHFRSMTLSEANADRASRGDVPLERYTWSTYLRDKRDGLGFVLWSITG